MPTYSKNAEGQLVETTGSEVVYTRAQLEANKAAYQAIIDKMDALLAECDKAGVK